MKLLRCKICMGEMDIIGNNRDVNKKVKCRECGFTNVDAVQKEPEVVVIRRRTVLPDPGTI